MTESEDGNPLADEAFSQTTSLNSKVSVPYYMATQSTARDCDGGQNNMITPPDTERMLGGGVASDE